MSRETPLVGMPNGVLFSISVILALVTGTAAAILSLLILEILQQSPFGRAVFVLSLVMGAFVLYHATLLVMPGPQMFAEVIKSTMYTGVAVFVWIMAWNQYRIRSGASGEVRS